MPKSSWPSQLKNVINSGMVHQQSMMGIKPNIRHVKARVISIIFRLKLAPYFIAELRFMMVRLPKYNLLLDHHAESGVLLTGTLVPELLVLFHEIIWDCLTVCWNVGLAHLIRKKKRLENRVSHQLHQEILKDCVTFYRIQNVIMIIQAKVGSEIHH